MPVAATRAVTRELSKKLSLHDSPGGQRHAQKLPSSATESETEDELVPMPPPANGKSTTGPTSPYTTTEDESEPSPAPAKGKEVIKSSSAKTGAHMECKHCRKLRRENFALQQALADTNDVLQELQKCRVGDLADLREATGRINVDREMLRVKADALAFQAEVLKRHAETMKNEANRPLSWKFEGR